MKESERRAINLITAFFSLWAVQLTLGITVRNPLTVVLFVCLFAAKEKMDDLDLAADKKSFAGIALFGLPAFFSAAMTFLTYKRASEGFTSSLFKLLTVIILLTGFYCLTFYCLRALLLLVNLNKLTKKVKHKEPAIVFKPLDKKGELWIFMSVTFICFVCFIPYFLYEFPGIMTADSMVQFEQIFADEPLSNHHPIIHTLTIGGLIKLGLMFTGDLNTSVAFYTASQMLFICCCFGLLVVEVTRLAGGYNRKVVVGLTALLALMPFNAVFAVTMWKDVPFAGVSVLFSCLLVEMYRKRDTLLKPYLFVLFTLLGVIFGLLRSNAFYAIIAFSPVFLFTFRKHVKSAAASVVLVILVTSVIKGPVYGSFGIKSPDFTESLSVPLQQVARVLVEDRPVSESDLDLIDEVIDRTYIKELYVPGFADNIKELVRAGHPEVLEENKGRYFSLWARLLIRNPGQYISAWFDLVGGYIYPDVAYEVGNIDGIIANDHGLVQSPVIGGKFIKVKEILIKLSDFMPLYGMFFSIGAYTWALIASFVIAVRKKRCILVHVLMGLMIATLLAASPVVDFRYAYAVVLTSPLFVTLAAADNRTKGQ